MVPLAIDLLGGFTARARGRVIRLQRRKAQALLAYLALRPGHRLSRETLTALLWADVPGDQARHSLRQVLLELRNCLPPGGRAALVIEGNRIALDPAGAEVDVATFEHLAAKDDRDSLERAVALYRGDLLEGLALHETAFEDWVRAERDRLRETALRTLQRLLSRLTADGELDRAVDTALRVLAIDPLQESAHRALIQLYERMGRRPDALRQYDRCVEILRRELRVTPGPETQRAYEALMARPERDASPVLTRPSRDDIADIPLVGRAVEIEHIRRAVTDAGRGRGRVILLTGEAGVGKTRLLQEIEGHGHSAGFRSLLGRCYDLTRVLAFSPWIEALRVAGVVHETEATRRLRPGQRAHLSRLLPEMSGGDGQTAERAEDPTSLFEAVVILLEGLATRRPLLVMLEDIHWADEMSVRLFFHLGRRLGSARVLLVATLRADEPGPGGHRSLADFEREWPTARIAVQTLSRRDSGTLARALASADTLAAALEQIEDQVWELSQGNPFMIVETMRALPALVADGAASARSTRIVEVVERRLSQLSEAARRVTAIVAVAGRDVEFDILWRTSELSEREAADALEMLVRRRILHEVGPGFDFVHDIVREAAGRRLIQPQRRALHHMLADALETLRAHSLDAHLSTLAVHFLGAEVWDKAYAYLARAARQAIDRSAWRDALAFIERALEAVDRMPETAETCLAYIDLVLERYAAFDPLGLTPKAQLSDLERAHAMAEAAGDPVRVGRTAAKLAQCAHFVGDSALAKEHAGQAIAAGEAAGDVAGPALARLILTEILDFEGDSERAIAMGRQNLVATSGSQRATLYSGQTLAVVARMFLSWTLARQGDFVEALQHAHEVLAIAESVDRPYSLACAYYTLGGIHLHSGDRAAIPILEQGRELTLTRVHCFQSGVAAMLGLAYARGGRVEEAIALLEEGAERVRFASLRVEPYRLVGLATGYTMVGRFEDALRTVERGIELARTHRSRFAEAWGALAMATIAVRQDPPAPVRALAYGSEALAGSLAMGTRPLSAHCYLALSRAYRQAGDSVRCDEHLAKAVAMYDEMKMSNWLEASDRPSTVVHA